MSHSTVWWAILIMAAVTALLRFLPFLLFREGKTPAWVERLGKALPAAVMGMLVVYCLKDTSLTSPAGFVPALAASAITVLSYLWKKKSLLSIVAGTAVYMVLVQFVFR